MQRSLVALLVTAALPLSPVIVQADAGHSHHAASANAGDAAYVQGEVKRIDRKAATISLKHGPIPNLDMPGMSMVFHVADGAMLDRVREGDKVRFKAGKVNGVLTVTDLRLAGGKPEAAAFGAPVDPKKAKRTVAVDMSDAMRFSPARIEVKRGETLRFIATNKGKLDHEMVLGTRQELEEHAQMMRRFPGMEHDEPSMIKVAPGKSGEMGWQFTQAGEFYYGCLEPGHFEAGMVGTVVVR